MQQIFNSKQLRYTPYHLFYAIAAIITCVLIWFIPQTNQWCMQLDKQFFLILNHTLTLSIYWQQFCGWLNHPDETWLNLIVMLGINFLAIAYLEKPKRKQALFFVLYCWIFFQFGLLLSHLIFGDLLAIERASPSLVVTPVIKLSELVKLSLIHI